MNNQDQYRCFIDDTEGCLHCALDEDEDTSACELAMALQSQGYGKTECEHWLHIKTMSDRLTRIEAEDQSRLRIQKAARNRMEQIVTSQINELHQFAADDKSDTDRGFFRKIEIQGC